MVILLSIAYGCTTTKPVANPDEISLEQAVQFLESGQVATLFQPHIGPVGMELRDGRSVCFTQPHIDWVLKFAADNGHESKIDHIYIE